VKSMTGFGHAEADDEALLASVDIRSYNNRFLELSVQLPSYLSVLEPRVRGLLTGRVERGKVEVIVRISELAERGTIVVDQALASSYVRAMQDLSTLLGTGERPHLAHLVRMEGIFKVRKERDEERFWSLVKRMVEQALAGFEESRNREGAHTHADIAEQISIVERELAAAASLAPALETRIREGLRARLAELVGDQYEESRLLAETAQQLARFDVNEELKRMGAHLAAFRGAADSGGACGRMLDFVCQELHREINTLGSKSVMLELDQCVLRMKEALEKIREQVRNVE
jgi:uncharacterized protein (TIGR00255 family)